MAYRFSRRSEMSPTSFPGLLSAIARSPKSLQIRRNALLASWSQKAGGCGRRGGKTIGGGDMPIEDDDRPRKKISHEIGQDLSLLSVEELTERIALLSSEIERLQAAAAKKRASKDVANSIFKS
jgi:uncharacterized small protein (DUF1192 family)